MAARQQAGRMSSRAGDVAQVRKPRAAAVAAAQAGRAETTQASAQPATLSMLRGYSAAHLQGRLGGTDGGNGGHIRAIDLLRKASLHPVLADERVIGVRLQRQLTALRVQVGGACSTGGRSGHSTHMRRMETRMRRGSGSAKKLAELERAWRTGCPGSQASCCKGGPSGPQGHALRARQHALRPASLTWPTGQN